jgi:hyperosmotically inducible periplasmic protein
MKIKLIRSSTIYIVTSIFLLNGLSLHASEIDNGIESAAADSYVYKTYLKDDVIKTKSDNGVVTLTGHVSAKFHKLLAQDTVAVLPNVKSVNNQLVVKEETTIDNADRWLRLKVETALLFHKNVNVMTTRASAENGTIYLRGQAIDMVQKDLTTEYTEDVKGVKIVKNEMTISNTLTEPRRTLSEKVDDASITALVKASQLAHFSTSTITTKVATRDGIVTISGVAKNDKRKKYITKLASDIHGVSKVINEMTIKKN